MIEALKHIRTGRRSLLAAVVACLACAAPASADAGKVLVFTGTLPASAEAGAAHARHATTAANNERRPVRMCLRAWIMAGSWRG